MKSTIQSTLTHPDHSRQLLKSEGPPSRMRFALAASTGSSPPSPIGPAAPGSCASHRQFAHSALT